MITNPFSTYSLHSLLLPQIMPAGMVMFISFAALGYNAAMLNNLS